jgi:hypothetical protein
MFKGDPILVPEKPDMLMFGAATFLKIKIPIPAGKTIKLLKQLVHPGLIRI